MCHHLCFSSGLNGVVFNTDCWINEWLPELIFLSPQPEQESSRSGSIYLSSLEQSILKEISPEYSLEGLVLKLKLQYSEHLMWRTDTLEKTLMLWKIEGRRRRGWQRIKWLDSITDSMDVSSSKLWELVIDREAWSAAVHSISKSQTRLSDWTELNWEHLPQYSEHSSSQ